MKSVVAIDDQDGQEALRSMGDALIDVRQRAIDQDLKFLSYLIEMAIVEVGELQGHSCEGVKPVDEPQPLKPITSRYTQSSVFAKNINR